MTPFLKQVAEYFYGMGDISGRCFIFPNRRSMLFFRKYLAEAVARDSDTPLLMPGMYTVNDFFCRLCGVRVAGRVPLLLELYRCYSGLNPQAESLDDFIFWGDVLLGDFDDVDKYLADPAQLYANISDLKHIQDSYSYLTERQVAAIRAFVRHFSDSEGRLTVDIGSDSPDMKGRFLHIWNLLHPLYESFNDELKKKGMAYEGMVYRSLARKIEERPVSEVLSEVFDRNISYVFVGLNALNECEKSLMRRMRDAGLASFCWDFPGDLISHQQNKSSFFMMKNVQEFPQAFQPETDGVDSADFNVVDVPSSYGQVKMVPSILSRLYGNGDDFPSDMSDTALVLPDESLLVPMLDTIDPRIQDINVTMGYPMSLCSLYVLMRDIARMQVNSVRRSGEICFYHRHVWEVLQNGLFRRSLSESGLEIVCRLKKEARHYLTLSDFAGDVLMESVFRPVVEDPSSPSSSQISAFALYLQGIIGRLASALTDETSSVLETEFAKEYYCALNSLMSMEMDIRPDTFVRLLESILSGASVPFKGEPLKGLQIMGPLETRALDFRNVVILSCNEGMFPRRSVSSSFIPPELRKAFQLPTYEYQDAVWAYYFYRLIARAGNVWMLYDSRTEGLRNGEESRYIKQLRYHFGVPLKRYTAQALLKIPKDNDSDIWKTPEILQKVNGMYYSASAVQNYVICPMKFYYHSVAGIRKDDELSESLDSKMIGNVYHNVMRDLFHGEEAMAAEEGFDKLGQRPDVGMEHVGAGYLSSWLERTEDIRRKVRFYMLQESGRDEISGRDLISASVIERYVLETLKRDIRLLESVGKDGFRIFGLEKKVLADMYGAHFFAVMDRIDSIRDGMVRLVDYKSGNNDAPEILDVSSSKDAVTAVERIFDSPYQYRNRYKAALQFYIYEKMLASTPFAKNADICCSMYAAKHLFKEVPQIYGLNPEFVSMMDERLQQVMDQIRDPEVPFRRTADTDSCEYCDFRLICGR